MSQDRHPEPIIDNSIVCENGKRIFVDLYENARGPYIRMRESGQRGSIIIPLDALDEVERAITKCRQGAR